MLGRFCLEGVPGPLRVALIKEATEDLRRAAAMLRVWMNSSFSPSSHASTPQLSRNETSFSCKVLLPGWPLVSPSKSRQSKRSFTSPCHLSLLQAFRSSDSDKDPEPSSSRPLKAVSTDPKCSSAHVLKERRRSALSGSYSFMLMVPERSLSKCLQAPTALPLYFSFSAPCLNSIQETLLELSSSSSTRHAFKGWPYCCNISARSSCQAASSGSAEIHSGGSHLSSHAKSSLDIKWQPKRSSDCITMCTQEALPSGPGHGRRVRSAKDRSAS
mmetsp:Transcript_55617/g.132570  ORF Transcript_55617/g.132570 Transcript_55617/m.132570 type:complete len:272 (-) Transcript_55617:888-1703(-)